MLRSCYSHINVSTEQQERQTDAEREREVEAVQQRALNTSALSSFHLTLSIPFDNPNSGRQTVCVPLKLLTPSETQAKKRGSNLVLFKALPIFTFEFLMLKEKPTLKHLNTMELQQLLLMFLVVCSLCTEAEQQYKEKWILEGAPVSPQPVWSVAKHSGENYELNCNTCLISAVNETGVVVPEGGCFLVRCVQSWKHCSQSKRHQGHDTDKSVKLPALIRLT